MTPQEANKIISIYMDVNPWVWVDGVNTGKLKYQSLDALFPVWENLNVAVEYLPQGNGCTFLINHENYQTWASGKTIQEAAAIATAKAIHSLTEDNA